MLVIQPLLLNFKVVFWMEKHDSKIDKLFLKNILKVLLISACSYRFSHDSLDNVSKIVEIKFIVIRRAL